MSIAWWDAGRARAAPNGIQEPASKDERNATLRNSRTGELPLVHRFVGAHLDMQFADVRQMLSSRGLNFPVAALLGNFISGISVVIYNRNLPAGRGDRGVRFREVATNYFPWETGEDIPAKVEVLYDFTRNSFAHALGLLRQGEPDICITKHADALSEAQLQEIECALARLNWLALAVDEAGHNSWRLSAESLYRGVFHILWNLVRDQNQMTQTERDFAAGRIMDR
jgi:hypothetical protein